LGIIVLFYILRRLVELLRVINTGGTFNKIYDPVKGELVVPPHSKAVESALYSLKHGCKVTVQGLLYKDSLDMDDSDRKKLCDAVFGSCEDMIVVVHGTDTMHKSASVIDRSAGGFHEKRVVLTGAMVPFSIDPVEATANLASAITAVRYLAPGVYIAMHGYVLLYENIVKNRERGVFERVE